MTEPALTQSAGIAPIVSVWATGQRPSRIQRRGRYVPESMKHPGKMLPAIASQAIAAFTRTGELVIDPMCGIGTTLVEAVHLGREAAGIEYEPQWARLASANLAHAAWNGATGKGQVFVADARYANRLMSGMAGRAALVLTSPPYGSTTHGHVRSTRDTGQPGIRKWNHHYSRDRANLAHQRLPVLLAGFGQILCATVPLLRPGGLVAVTVRPYRVRGELVDLPGHVQDVAQRAGLVLADRIVCLLCGLRDGRLVNRASFFQMHEARKAQQRGVPIHALAHEDLLIFSKPPTRGHARQGSGVGEVR